MDANLSLSELKDIAKNLPEVNELSYANSNLKGKIESKSVERENLQSQLNDAQELLSLLEANSTLSGGHFSQLRFLELTSQLTVQGDSLVCPICHGISNETSNELKAIHNSREELKNEMTKIGVYKEDNTKQIEELRKQRNSLKRKIAKISAEISDLEGKDKELQEKRSLRDFAFMSKGFAEANINNLLSKISAAAESTDIDELKERIKLLKEKLGGFDLKSKIKDAEVFLSKRMTNICNQLDFEDELKPGKLRFTIEDFGFYYHFKEKEKIYLSEMGSGANWLACHLSLFIALLHLNCKENKSSIPSFLFIDQPSQVYFPTKYGEVENDSDSDADENIKQVRNIFRVLIDALAAIKEDCGFMPQIIVAEHADEDEFKSYVKKRWTKDGDKLI